MTIGQYMAAAGTTPRAEFRRVIPMVSVNDFGKAKGANKVTDMKLSINFGRWPHLKLKPISAIIIAKAQIIAKNFIGLWGVINPCPTKPPI